MDDQRGVERDEQKRPEKAEPLDDVGEDKVAGGDGEEFHLRLRGVFFVFAEKAPRTDGDDRLLDLVARFFPDEIVEALFLVIVQLGIDERQGDDEGDSQPDPDFPFDADDEQHAESQQRKHGRRPQVGFLGDQEKRQENVKRELGEIFEAVAVARWGVAADQVREHQDKGGFDQLGGLEGEMNEGDLDPPFGTQPRMADELDGEQQQNPRPVHDRDHPEHPANRQQKHRDEDADPHGGVDHLFLPQYGMDFKNEPT